MSLLDFLLKCLYMVSNETRSFRVLREYLPFSNGSGRDGALHQNPQLKQSTQL
jgi:hypothetical protein